jgi:membrane-associated protease RseP (regulator of RpoE activity)
MKPVSGEIALPSSPAEIRWVEEDSLSLSPEAMANSVPTFVPPPDISSVVEPPIRRRFWLPVILFLLTCVSTFIAGACRWAPDQMLLFTDDPLPFRRSILLYWREGLLYMFWMLLTLFFHEMGHFLATVYYRIPASFPYFLPLPITPIGTMGAVIRMDNRDADRKQMFDIGIAGPLAGLVVAIPLIIVGVQRLDLTTPGGGPYSLDLPLAIRWLMQWIKPHGFDGHTALDVYQLNPYFMAGWVGILVTALNMMPVSQLDGGHVTYTLFGRQAHWIARAFMVAVIGYMVYTNQYQMMLMVILILLIGVDHPPTSNDRVEIGPVRFAIGLVSLVIPFVSLTPMPIIQR